MKAYVICGPVYFDGRSGFNRFSPACITDGEWESKMEAAEAVLASDALKNILGHGEWRILNLGVDDPALIKDEEKYYHFVETRRLETAIGTPA